jgi:hypothetical protein
MKAMEIGRKPGKEKGAKNDDTAFDQISEFCRKRLTPHDGRRY